MEKITHQTQRNMLAPHGRRRDRDSIIFYSTVNLGCECDECSYSRVMGNSQMNCSHHEKTWWRSPRGFDLKKIELEGGAILMPE